jgi:hypothetical protein
VRIGIHAGEPVADHNDLFGATVHSPMACVAKQKPMEYWSSGVVRDLMTRIRRTLLNLICVP